MPNKEILKIKLENESARLPRYAHDDDSGLDLFAAESKKIFPGKRALVSTGIRIELPDNTECQIRPRSGLALKYGVTVLNSPATIDRGYIGVIEVILINHGDEVFLVKEGDAIAQMVIAPVLKAKTVQVDQLTETDRGEKGFGSTGNF